MKVFSIETMRFKVDGGAMFGVVPKTMWEEKYPADFFNLCTCACRSLLIDTGEHKVLIDTGIGDKLSDEELNHYVTNRRFDLHNSLKQYGYKADDITHVVITHLHFDHCGGSVNKTDKGELVPAFKNAKYYISKTHWEQATNPNRREKPSFIESNYIPLYENNKIVFVDDGFELIDGVKLKIFNGHTIGLLSAFVNTGEKTLVFAGDMMPAAVYVPLSWISAYDVQPLIAIEEKQNFLKEAFENEYVIFFQHDAYNECGTIKETQRGYRIDKLGKLTDFFK
ncbi:MAG TPA: MBL fold metallo-hydrolase [Bacteroidales bacterium]|nr:MBL fold metallo-hydrolase [Bacteroidales bacterium]MDD4236059.1 MBL fold metallo-hydrolase [Bacteroidales bacterium]HXK81695.1 MBL fold metallo-hydrolase [Bacteroidales bacterium]